MQCDQIAQHAIQRQYTLQIMEQLMRDIDN